MNQQCCENCLQTIGHMTADWSPIRECLEPHCPCHAVPSKAEEKKECTHSQHPSGAMYCLRPDGCTYPYAPKVAAPTDTNKQYKQLNVKLSTEGNSGYVGPTDTNGDWRVRFDTAFTKIAGSAGKPEEWISLDHSGVQQLKSFIAKEIERAREEGITDFYKTLQKQLPDILGSDIELVLKQQYEAGRAAAFKSVRELAAALMPPACDCTGAKYECEHWGRHEALSDLLNQLEAKQKEHGL